MTWDEKFAKEAVQAINNLIQKPTDTQTRKKICLIRKSIQKEPTSGHLAFASASKDRHIAAHLLYALAPHLRLTRSRVTRGELLTKFLSCLQGVQNVTVSVDDVQEMTLFAYWCEETMQYCDAALELLKQ